MQTDRLTRLIEHVLDVTRITSGRLALDLETFDLAIVVREVVDRLRDDLERANCELTLDATEVIGRWDRSRIDQIAMNLLSNAIKYGKGKPILVHVGGDASVARLRVTDHGIGIAAEHHQRIFERFERAVPVRNFGGLGLGLWITRQLVEAHDGTVSVESAPDAGASFTVTLPIHTGDVLP